MKFLLFLSPLWLVDRCTLFFSGSKSSQASSTSSSNQVADSRVGVSDQGVAASGGSAVDQSSNDNRSFDDHSVFAIDAQNHAVTDSGNTATVTDARDFSDRSSFTDSSTTNITTSDPETLKELAKGAFSAATKSTEQGSAMLGMILEYGDALTTRAMGDVNETRAMAARVVDQVVGTTKSASEQNTEKFVKALTIVGVVAAGAFAASKIFGRKAA